MVFPDEWDYDDDYDDGWDNEWDGEWCRCPTCNGSGYVFMYFEDYDW